MSCTKSSHEELKSPSVWEALPLLGRDEGVLMLEFRNCPHCDSTLVIEIAHQSERTT